VGQRLVAGWRQVSAASGKRELKQACSVGEHTLQLPLKAAAPSCCCSLLLPLPLALPLCSLVKVLREDTSAVLPFAFRPLALDGLLTCLALSRTGSTSLAEAQEQAWSLPPGATPTSRLLSRIK